MRIIPYKSIFYGSAITKKVRKNLINNGIDSMIAPFILSRIKNLLKKMPLTETVSTFIVRESHFLTMESFFKRHSQKMILFFPQE